MKTRIGEKHITKEGYEVEIIEYLSCSNCVIKFENGEVLTGIKYSNLSKGSVKNPNHKSLLGVGFLGVGNYKPKINGKITEYYNSWKNMIQRCYDENYHKRQPTYKVCSVHEDWHNFQNYAKWFEENYKKDYAIDKDILFKNNKIYSPETCCFVPQEINSLFTKRQNNRGYLPIGVCERRGKFKHKIFQASITKNSKTFVLGYYDTPVKAFTVYKKAKEDYIKEIAGVWKYKILPKVYKALINYKVEITD